MMWFLCLGSNTVYFAFKRERSIFMLCNSTDVVNGKRGHDAEHERLAKETQLINEQQNLQED